MSKHRIITEHFRDMIISGKAKPGARLSTDNEIAQNFQVNTRTVAKGMAQLVADGLITRTPGRGSVVMRQKIVVRSSSAVGVVAYNSGHIFRDLAAEITEGLLKHDSYPVWITQNIFREGITNPNYQPFIKMIEHFVNECPHGMIVEGERFVPYDLLSRNLPKVRNLIFVMTYLHKERIPGRYILVDFKEGGRQAARYFHKMGHRKIAFLPYAQPLRGNGYGQTTQEIVYEEMVEEFRALGGNVATSVFDRLIDGESMDTVIKEEYRNCGFTGVLVAYDNIWVNKAAPIFREMGLRIPDDISAIGFNDTPWCESAEPRLSSFSIHEKQIGKIAVQMLYDEISVKEIILNPELIERDSVKNLNL